ncbi:MAG: putative thiamine biosynthesis protein [Pseudomonadota bacterium]|jgi:sulfur carrier protein
MIAFTLNGAPHQLPAAGSIADLIASLGLTGKRMAVEQNGEIVPKSRHATTPVASGDRIEIVVAVGGG